MRFWVIRYLVPKYHSVKKMCPKLGLLLFTMIDEVGKEEDALGTSSCQPESAYMTQKLKEIQSLIATWLRFVKTKP